MMRFPAIFSRRALMSGVSAIASAAILGGGAIAQEATPAAEHVGPSEDYPVGIYQGTCEDVSGDPAYEIGDAITFGATGEEGDEPQTVGSAEGVSTVLLGISATVDASLEDLGSEGHVIAVLEGDQVVACGQVAGVVSEGELAMAIPSWNEGQVVGVALLSDADGQTEAKVYLFDTGSVDEDLSATPQA